MIKNLNKTIGNIAIVFLASLIVIGFLYIASAKEINIGNTTIYISSKYGTKCYQKGNEHGNIKYPIEFNNEEDCIKFINK